MRSKANHCVYNNQVGENFIYVVLYDDDMFFVGNNMEVINEVKLQLSSKFNMKDVNATNYSSGMDIKRSHIDRMLLMNQRKYVEAILHRFNMKECKLVKVFIPIGARLFVE